MRQLLKTYGPKSLVAIDILDEKAGSINIHLDATGYINVVDSGIS